MRFEPLEGRALLAANIQITNVLVVDASNNVVAAPVIGQNVFLRAEWRTTDLTPADQYVVRYSVDGVPLDSATITGAAGVNLGYVWYRGGWYASPGIHAVSVTIDGANVVTETTEVDNTLAINFTPITPTDLPSKFIWPMPSQQSRDWLFVNFNDVNPLPTSFIDYRGNTYAYDGHNAFDVSLPDFRSMDQGQPLFAAAAGTVVSAQDGRFDRQTTWSGQPANFVTIDHGNGWQTFYWHLARYTLTVSPGDAVQAGQIIGFTGSSGISTGAHVHFGVTYRGAVVETYYAPDTYYFNPPPYQMDAPVRSMGSGITNYQYIAAGDLGERAQNYNTFPNNYSGTIYFHYWTSRQRPGDTWSVTWYRPNGVVDWTSSGTYSVERRFWNNFWTLSRPWGNNPGTWQAVYTVNGVELARESFHIVDPALAVPEMRVRLNGAITLDERTTPYDFGSVAQGAPPPEQTWTIENQGHAALNLATLTLPTGFNLVTPLPPSIAPFSSATLTLQLDTSTPGYRMGEVRLITNDPDESPYTFNVEGTVTGAPVAGVPVVTTTARQTRYHAGNAAVVVDPGVVVSDPNTTQWTGGNLTVRFASSFNAGDVLGVRNQGTGAGQIGVNGVNVTFAGTPIGVISGNGVNGSPLVIDLNAAATTVAVQALARNITYVNSLTAPVTAARYLSFTATDETLLSATAYKTIVPLNKPATISDITNQMIFAGSSTGPLNFTLGDPDKARTQLIVAATSSNPTLIPLANLVLGGSIADRTINVTPAVGQIGTATITITVTDVNGGQATESFVVTVTANLFLATMVTPTPTGVVVQFNRELDPVDLNVIDVTPSLFGAADVTLVQGGTTNIAGSVTISPDRRAIAFVASNGLLPDGSYLLTLRSAANGFKDTGGNLLDGNNDGASGGDLTFNFTVASSARNVSIPSFARGPQQPVNVPATTTGLPLTISDGANVTQIGLTLFYDPAMLTISSASLATGLPVGASLNTDTSVTGRIVVTLNSPTPLPAGIVTFANLLASVPSGAPYTGKNLLDLVNVQVNGGAIPVRDADGVHVVAYVGDASANGSYSSLDAARISRVAVGFDTGFSNYQLLDPRLVGDVSGNGTISASDASRALQLGVGITFPNVPTLPGIAVTVSGPDPQLSIPTDLLARAGETLRIPVNLNSVIDLTGIGVAAADLALAFDTRVMEVLSVERGQLVADVSTWLLSENIDSTNGIVNIGLASMGETLEGVFSDSLVWLNVRILDDAPAGFSSLNLLNNVPGGSRQTLLNEGNLTLIPAVSNDAFDPGVDGLLLIQPSDTMDINRDGRVSGLDALLLINRLNGVADDSFTGDVSGEGESTAFDALQIINTLDQLARRVVPKSEIIETGFGEVGFELHSGGDHDDDAGMLPYLTAEHANLPGGLEPLLQLLALDAGRGNSVRISTVLPY